MNQKLCKRKNETIEEYCHRISSLKQELNLTWSDIQDILNSQTGENLSASAYRKRERKYLEELAEEDFDDFEDNFNINDAILELKTERAKLADERSQNNAIIRRMAREDTLKEIAHDFAEQMNSKKVFPKYNPIRKTGEHEAILLISDWHYGIEIDSVWNKYNPDIAKQRIRKLRDKVIEYINKEDVYTLHIVNLGDLIAGRIHLQLRINSRFDVITQIMEVSELLAEFINDVSEYTTVHYYDTLDNHSRLEPNLKESLELESLARITIWYLRERFKNRSLENNVSKIPSIIIHENIIADDIISFETMGHKVVGVHGNKDKPTKIIDNLTMMTKQHYDLVLAAHLHHFSCEEKNETVLVSNSSMMGTDDYAEKLRLCAKPSQCLIIVSKENACENVYKINLD